MTLILIVCSIFLVSLEHYNKDQKLFICTKAKHDTFPTKSCAIRAFKLREPYIHSTQKPSVSLFYGILQVKCRSNLEIHCNSNYRLRKQTYCQYQLKFYNDFENWPKSLFLDMVTVETTLVLQLYQKVMQSEQSFHLTPFSNIMQ